MVVHCSASLVYRQEFDSKRLLESHRRTPAHRAEVAASKALDNPRCEFCDAKTASALDLKRHLAAEHPNECSQCSMCGARTTLPP